jgi:hypothetical protein
MTHEIIKQYNEKMNVWIIKCSKGCKMTSWKEGDNIKDYYSFEIAYCPKDTDLSVYHCISVEDDAILLEKQLEAFKKEESK